MDQWLAFAPALGAGPGLVAAAAQANEYLAARTFLVGHRLTLADIAVWGELAGAQGCSQLFVKKLRSRKQGISGVGSSSCRFGEFVPCLVIPWFWCGVPIFLSGYWYPNIRFWLFTTRASDASPQSSLGVTRYG